MIGVIFYKMEVITLLLVIILIWLYWAIIILMEAMDLEWKIIMPIGTNLEAT